MKDGINNEENTQQNKNKKSLGTGAKVAIASLGVLALLGGGIIATLAGIDFIEDCKESKNAESLVSICIDSDRLVTLPEQIIVDREYDVKYCSGEKLIEELTEANAQYCCIDGQYYTEKGVPQATE